MELVIDPAFLAKFDEAKELTLEEIDPAANKGKVVVPAAAKAALGIKPWFNLYVYFFTTCFLLFVIVFRIINRYCIINSSY